MKLEKIRVFTTIVWRRILLLPLRINSQPSNSSPVNWRAQTSSPAPTHPSHFIHGIYFSNYLRKPYFQCTRYIICKLCCWYLYIEDQQLKFTHDRNKQYVLQSAQIVHHFNFSQILLIFSSSCFTPYLDGNEVSLDNVHQRGQG